MACYLLQLYVIKLKKQIEKTKLMLILYRYAPLQINETEFDSQGEQPGLVKYLRSGVIITFFLINNMRNLRRLMLSNGKGM